MLKQPEPFFAGAAEPIDAREPQTELNIRGYGVELSSETQIKQKLRISVTDACNFNCFFCHNEGQGALTKDTAYMSVPEIVKLVEVATACGIRSVKLTGGEPLIYRYQNADIVELVGAINELRKDTGRNFSLSMVTNGYLLDQYASRLREAGLDRVTVSLTTLSDTTFHKYIRAASGSVSRVLSGIGTAVQTGLSPVKVNTVIFSSRTHGVNNIVEIPRIIQACRQLKVAELRLYTLLWHAGFPTFDEYYQYWDSQVLSADSFLDANLPDDLRDRLLSSLRNFASVWSPSVYPKARMVIDCDGLPVAFETMMAGRYGVGGACVSCEHPDKCQEGPYALRVSARGDVRGCLLGSHSINLLTAMRSAASDAALASTFSAAFSLLPKTL